MWVKATPFSNNLQNDKDVICERETERDKETKREKETEKEKKSQSQERKRSHTGHTRFEPAHLYFQVTFNI